MKIIIRLLVCVFGGLIIPATSSAQEILCDTSSSNEQHQLILRKTDDIYSFSKYDFEDGYRIAAQYLSQPEKLKIYIYSNVSKNRYVLISSQEYLLDSTHLLNDSFGNYKFYADKLERELFLSCRMSNEILK